MNIIKLQNDSDVATKTAEIIKNSGVVILPFDTVYGFACKAKDDVLNKLFDIKKRPQNKTIGLAVSNIEKLKSIAELNIESEKYIKERTPGRYTFILKAKENSISDYCIQNGTIGVRIPDSKLVLDIIEKSGGIIAQTSANLSGEPNCFSVQDLIDQYGQDGLNGVDLIIDGGALEDMGASQLVDLTGDGPKEIERV